MRRDHKDLVVLLVFLELMAAVESPGWLDLQDQGESPVCKDLKERKEKMVASLMSLDHLDLLDPLDHRVERENVVRRDAPDLSSLDLRDHQEIKERRDVLVAKESLEARDQSERKGPKETVSIVLLLVLHLGIKMELRSTKYSRAFNLLGDVQ